MRGRWLEWMRLDALKEEVEEECQKMTGRGMKGMWDEVMLI